MNWQTLENQATIAVLKANPSKRDEQVIELAVAEIMQMRQVSIAEAKRVLMDLARNY